MQTGFYLWPVLCPRQGVNGRQEMFWIGWRALWDWDLLQKRPTLA
jgi:hypothetical protein